ncbi:unnamed protein product [Heligmosomoides polygyrus]|uniref:Protein Asterix n=1 Tax=Heligmosomoides polygyrus TaxID=6339 RepID=A0A183FP95_HELPZ|nr:unnamed protein product [Heligmosomoides polygyrus]
MQATTDPRRPNKIVRFKAADPQANNTVTDDPLPEYMNMKWCAWMALLCSCVSFANTRSSDDAKQIVSSFMWVPFYLVFFFTT